MNHVRIFGNDWINSIDNSDIYIYTYIYICWCFPYFNCYFKTTPNINIPSVPSKKWTVQFSKIWTLSVSWGTTELTVLIILVYICWCFPYFNCYFKNNTQYKYPECPLEKWTGQFGHVNHVRIFGNDWINSIDNSDIYIFAGVYPISIVISKTTPNINIPGVPSKKCTVQFETMNHVRILGNGWINSIYSDTFSGVFLILIVISKTTPNINIPSVPSKKWTMQFEYLANFTHRMSDFSHWIFECPMSNILLTSHSCKNEHWSRNNSEHSKQLNIWWWRNTVWDSWSIIQLVMRTYLRIYTLKCLHLLLIFARGVLITTH